MDNLNLNSNYWNNRYSNHETGWDIGSPSIPIVKYVNQLSNKEIRILIPGCGYGYEAEYLFNNGFKNVFVLDYSELALLEFKKRVPQFPKSNLIETDFFKHNKSYDLIIEQTFFCALNPNLRKDYVLHCSSLLNKNGKLIGLLFNDDLNETHPPFGGNKTEYELIFSTHFNLNIIDNCYNSIEPRKGKELFINLSKK